MINKIPSILNSPTSNKINATNNTNYFKYENMKEKRGSFNLSIYSCSLFFFYKMNLYYFKK